MLNEIFKRLNLEESDSLIKLSDTNWKEKVTFPSRVIRLLEDIKKWDPKAVFCFDNKPLVLFFENPENKEILHKTAWNFNETPIIIVVEDSEVSIYNGFAIDENTNLLKQLGGSDKLNDFNYFELVTGKTFEKYNKEFDYLHRVDYRLLKNIESAQDKLLNEYKCSRKTANALLGKIIFVRYLIDRKVRLNFEGVSKEWTNEEFCELLLNKQRVYEFFQYLQSKDKGFNGDLFPIDEDFKNIDDGAFGLIKRLLEGDDIKTGQKSLFQLYDFSVLPIEFISNVYERFIGKENQAKAGAYYTPTFLVDYIISQTVTKKLNEKANTASCKVLDPACGSGIFLVETLRKIIEKHISINGICEDKQKFKNTIKQLAKDNIFGIDKDESAVQVAIFSIYLTLLDYQDPPEIETFKFPELLNTNFFVADFFNTEADYNNILKEQNFDFILGNPPWFRGKGEKEKPLYVTYITDREKDEKLEGQPPCRIGGKEIAQAFLIRSSDFSDENTENALIVTSKTLYNLKSVDFRAYFLHNFKIKRVFELAPVRREVFEKSNKKAVAPACILFFKHDKTQDNDNNIIEHITLKPSRFFSLFKIFTINRSDFKRVQQKKLKENDWLWKVLVYGSYLDFNFISRLKSEFQSIDKFLSQYKVIRKQGVKRVDGEKKINVSELKGWNFLDLSKEIKQNYISEKHSKWKLDEVGYIYRENNEICKEIFTPPMLLIKETVNTKLESISAVSFQRLLFTDKVTSLKFLDEDRIDIYRLISALLNSSMFAYYVMNISSTAGIMIEQQINDEERFSFPYVYSKEIIETVIDLEKLQDAYYSKTLSDHKTLTSISKKREQINDLICAGLSLTNEEMTLLRYTVDVTIPIQMKHKGFEKLLLPFGYKEKKLADYAQLFLNRFQANLSNDKGKFIVEIWHTKQIIGMFFQVVPLDEYKDDIVWENKQDDTSGILQFLISIGSSEITDKLFVQKDIRGFEKDYFYIFKPNEKRLWHKAIGYLDVNEFADAMLRAGRDMR
jgi:hypothetical protein